MSILCVRRGGHFSIFEVRHVEANGEVSIRFEIRDLSGNVIATASELSQLELRFQELEDEALEEEEEYRPRMRP